MKGLLLFLISFTVFSAGCRLFEKTAPTAPKTDTPYVYSEITSPSVGAVIFRGSTMIIKWNGFKVKTVTLELWKKKLYNHQTIASDIENHGSFNWVVPAETPASVSYQVKLISSDDPSDYIYSEVFAIK